MIGASSRVWLEPVGGFLESRTGRALAWGIPGLIAVTAVLWGLWWGMRR